MAITSGKIIVWKNDGILADLGYVTIQGAFLVLPTGTSDPVAGSITTPIPNGAAYFNTSTGFLRIFNGGAWANH